MLTLTSWILVGVYLVYLVFITVYVTLSPVVRVYMAMNSNMHMVFNFIALIISALIIVLSITCMETGSCGGLAGINAAILITIMLFQALTIIYVNSHYKVNGDSIEYNDGKTSSASKAPAPSSKAPTSSSAECGKLPCAKNCEKPFVPDPKDACNCILPESCLPTPTPTPTPVPTATPVAPAPATSRAPAPAAPSTAPAPSRAPVPAPLPAPSCSSSGASIIALDVDVELDFYQPQAEWTDEHHHHHHNYGNQNHHKPSMCKQPTLDEAMESVRLDAPSITSIATLYRDW